MNLSEVNWDINAIGTWPLAIKTILILVVCGVVAGGCIYLDTMDQIAALQTLEKKELELRGSFEQKQSKVANFEDYQNQLTEIQARLDEMIKQMPTEAEVASLLVDISQTGLASGLDFKLFKPESAVVKDFYSELPIKIDVTGKYEELGAFVSGLAALPRIVTVHDVNIEPQNTMTKDKEPPTNNILKMQATIKTYNEATASAKNATNKPKNAPNQNKNQKK